MARRLGSTFVLPLAFGPDADWCRNVLAAGDAVLCWKGERHAVTAPTIVGLDEVAAVLPGGRRAARLAGISRFLRVSDVAR